MFNARTLYWWSAPSLALPKLAELSGLARQGLAEAKRLAPAKLEELKEYVPATLKRAEPLARQAQATALNWTKIAIQKANTLLAEHPAQPSPIAPEIIVPPVATSNEAALPVRRVGLFKLSKLVLRLLLLAVAERAQPANNPAPATSKPASPWLISRKDDLLYMIGSSAVSYIFMALLFIFKVKPVTVYWLYALFFDAPHIFGTFSRTYADPDEWKKRRNLLLGSLLWFLPGPLMVKLGKGDYFDIFAYLWAYYHLVKQHYGFSILYKKKNNDFAKLDNLLDKALIWTGFTLPYVQFLFGPNYPTGYLRLSQILPSWTPKLALAAFLAAFSAYVARQVYKVIKQDKSLDIPKHLLLASSITMHMVTFQLPFASLGGGVASLASIVAILTVYHNVQYNRLIWFHNQNKYVKGAQQGENFGLASLFSKNKWRFIVCAFVFGAGYKVPLQLFSAAKFGINPKLARYIGAAGWGFAFGHYYLDSKIWRVRHDARLNKALQTAR